MSTTIMDQNGDANDIQWRQTAGLKPRHRTAVRRAKASSRSCELLPSLMLDQLEAVIPTHMSEECKDSSDSEDDADDERASVSTNSSTGADSCGSSDMETDVENLKHKDYPSYKFSFPSEEMKGFMSGLNSMHSFDADDCTDEAFVKRCIATSDAQRRQLKEKLCLPRKQRAATDMERVLGDVPRKRAQHQTTDLKIARRVGSETSKGWKRIPSLLAASTDQGSCADTFDDSPSVDTSLLNDLLNVESEAKPAQTEATRRSRHLPKEQPEIQSLKGKWRRFFLQAKNSTSRASRVSVPFFKKKIFEPGDLFTRIGYHRKSLQPERLTNKKYQGLLDMVENWSDNEWLDDAEETSISGSDFESLSDKESEPIASSATGKEASLLAEMVFNMETIRRRPMSLVCAMQEMIASDDLYGGSCWWPGQS